MPTHPRSANPPAKSTGAAGAAGFTLPELLIVVAVITLLASMLCSEIRTVRGSANSLTCMTSERQIGLAFAQYRADQGCFPPPFLCRIDSDGTRVLDFFLADGGIKSRFWYGALAGMLDDTRQRASRVWTCPDACFPKLTGSDAWAGSYGYNNSATFYVRTFNQTNGYTRGIKPERLSGAAACILLAERWAVDPSGRIPDLNWNVVPPWDGSGRTVQTTPVHAGGNSASLRLSHRGRSNYLFFDLHVAAYGPWERVAPGISPASESSATPNIWFGAE